MNAITRLLCAIEQGEAHATDEFFVIVYNELRTLAAAKLAHETPGQTLQTTALVHEAYLRLMSGTGCDDAAGSEAGQWQSRALGGMLYTLFTGVAPLDSEAMKGAGFDEICRVIREQAPLRPSFRLSRLTERVETLARQRATTPIRLRRALSRDLDWIVMKAMEKDRSRRYETASEFARDIERYLDHEPVSAGPPGVFYLAHKFVRRNRTAVTAAALVALTVTLGGVFFRNRLCTCRTRATVCQRAVGPRRKRAS
jgi:ECF sigma factor